MFDCKCGLETCLELEEEIINDELNKYHLNPRKKVCTPVGAEHLSNPKLTQNGMSNRVEESKLSEPNLLVKDKQDVLSLKPTDLPITTINGNIVNESAKARQIISDSDKNIPSSALATGNSTTTCNPNISRYNHDCDQNIIKIYASGTTPKDSNDFKSYAGAADDMDALLGTTFDMDQSRPLNLENIMKYIRISLTKTNISDKIFAHVVLGISEGRFSELLLHPHKNYNNIRHSTLFVYRKIFAYLVNQHAIEYMFLRYGKCSPQDKTSIDLFNPECMLSTPSVTCEDSSTISRRLAISETFKALLPRMAENKFESVLAEKMNESGSTSGDKRRIVGTIKIDKLVQQMKGLLFATKIPSSDFCNAAFNITEQQFETIVREPINWCDCTDSQKQGYTELAYFITNDDYVKDFKKHGLQAVNAFRAYLACQGNLPDCESVVKSEVIEIRVDEDNLKKEFDEELQRELFKDIFEVDYKLYLLILYYSYMEKNEDAINAITKWTTINVDRVKKDLLVLKDSKMANLRPDENNQLGNDIVNPKILLMEYVSKTKLAAQFKMFDYQLRHIKYLLDPDRFGTRQQ
uniref:CUT domain-containing protein n=1 Tax=Rhabditophanes sp. KR3021 TaxID=114890 RepID=A0AC35TUF6_9BILA